MEKKRDENFQIKKISTSDLLDVLNDLYSKGVDYVDVYGLHEEEDRDTIGFSFCKDYMSEDYKDVFEDFETAFDEEPETKPNISVRFSDEDLNQLS